MCISPPTFWVVTVFLSLAAATTGAPQLSFRLSLSRTQHTNADTAVVIATLTNTGRTAFTTWGLFDYSGGYRPSAPTYERWRTIRDSSLAARDSAIAAGQKPYGDGYPRLPTILLLPRVFAGERLRRISLAPGRSYFDTLRIEIYPSTFELWPGYLDVAGEFLMGAGPDTAGVIRLGKHDLRVAIPVP